MMRVAAAAVLLIALIVPACVDDVGDYDEGSATIYTTLPQIYKTALLQLRPSAEQGEAWAQQNLGFMYQNGWSVPQDYIQAVEWFRKAAEQGFADAHYNLGNMYANGWGVRQDYE